MVEKDLIIDYVEEFLKNSENYLADVNITPGNGITVEIDNDNGVDIEDCVAISRYLESKLDRDAEDFELTVTSVGLTSEFKTVRQYKKYIGKEVEVLTKKGQKLSGILKSADDEGFVLTITKKEKPDGKKRKIDVEEDINFNYDEIKFTKYLIRF